MSIGVVGHHHARDLGQLLLVKPAAYALSDYHDAMSLAHEPSLEDGSLNDFADLLKRKARPGELLRDYGNGGSRRLAYAQRKVPGCAPHHHHQVPAVGGTRVLHNVEHNLGAHLTRGLKAKGRHPAGQRQVVVYGLGNVDHPQRFIRGVSHLGGSKGGVVAADGDKIAYAQLLESLANPLQVFRLPRRVGPGSAQDGASLEVDTRDVGNGKWLHLVCAALYQMLKPIVDAHHLETGVDGLYSDGAYDAVYAGRGPASHQNTKSIGSHHLTASFISGLLQNGNKGNSGPEKLRDGVNPFSIIHHMAPRYARHYVLSSGPDSSSPRPLCHQPSLDSSRRLNPIALAPRQAEVSQLLHLPALLQGAGERSSLGRAKWEARRGTATEKGGEGSNHRTANRAQQGHQGTVGTSIRSLIAWVCKHSAYARCKQGPDFTCVLTFKTVALR